MSDIEIEFTAMEEFSFWLSDMEDQLVETAKKPQTRVEACQLLAKTKALLKEAENKELPDEMEDEENPKVEEFIGRYGLLQASLADNLAKAETLCVCWNKLNDNMGELTKSLTSSGAGKLTMDKLEASIRGIKDMFKERTVIMENLTPAGAEEC